MTGWWQRRDRGRLPPWAPLGDEAGDRPVALVYRSRDRAGRLCADALAEALETSRWRFATRFVGPAGGSPMSAEALGGARLYAQPGGGELEPAYRRLRRHRDDVRAYVAEGGHYLGVCLGGYLAGATPGFDLLPGDADRYIDQPEACIQRADEDVVPVVWRYRRRALYFQDGPCFIVDGDGAEVLARYPEGAVAALVAAFGRGRVGVVGPHPEAPADWFDDLRRPRPDGGRELLGDLLEAVLRP
jgi:hypothetical protein